MAAFCSLAGEGMDGYSRRSTHLEPVVKQSRSRRPVIMFPGVLLICLMFRKLRRLKSQPLKNDCVGVCGCVFVCAHACVYFFPKVETYFHKCSMGEARATAET